MTLFITFILVLCVREKGKCIEIMFRFILKRKKVKRVVVVVVAARDEFTFNLVNALIWFGLHLKRLLSFVEVEMLIKHQKRREPDMYTPTL